MLQTISTAFHQGGWGMWPILFTSVIIIAVIVERAVYLFRRRSTRTSSSRSSRAR